MFINTDVKIAHVEDGGYVLQLQWNNLEGGTQTKEYAVEEFGDLVLRLGHFFGKWKDFQTGWIETIHGEDNYGLIIGPQDFTDVVEENAALD